MAETIAADNLASPALTSLDPSGAIVHAALMYGLGMVMLYGGIGVWVMAALSFITFGVRNPALRVATTGVTMLAIELAALTSLPPGAPGYRHLVDSVSVRHRLRPVPAAKQQRDARQRCEATCLSRVRCLVNDQSLGQSIGAALVVFVIAMTLGELGILQRELHPLCLWAGAHRCCPVERHRFRQDSQMNVGVAFHQGNHYAIRTIAIARQFKP